MRGCWPRASDRSRVKKRIHQLTSRFTAADRPWLLRWPLPLGAAVGDGGGGGGGGGARRDARPPRLYRQLPLARRAAVPGPPALPLSLSALVWAPAPRGGHPRGGGRLDSPPVKSETGPGHRRPNRDGSVLSPRTSHPPSHLLEAASPRVVIVPIFLAQDAHDKTAHGAPLSGRWRARAARLWTGGGGQPTRCSLLDPQGAPAPRRWAAHFLASWCPCLYFCFYSCRAAPRSGAVSWWPWGHQPSLHTEMYKKSRYWRIFPLGYPGYRA